MVAATCKLNFSSEDEAEDNGGDIINPPKERPRKLSLGIGTGFPTAELTSLGHPLVRRVVHAERELVSAQVCVSVGSWLIISLCVGFFITYVLKKLVRLGCITQGSFAEITNQRFSLKYQTFRQLAAAFISGSGLQSVHVLNV